MAQKHVWYNGAKYGLVGQGFAEAQTGDLFQSLGNYSETEGHFYEITVDESKDFPIRFTDNRRISNGYRRKAKERNLYRKVKTVEPKPGYVEVKPEDLNVGDYVVFNKDGVDRKAGVYYEIKCVDFERRGKVRFDYLDDAYDVESEWADGGDDFKFYRKAVEAPTEPAPQYVAISGDQVEVGDFVKFTEGRVDITVGKYYELTKTLLGDGAYYTDDVNDMRFVASKDNRVKFYRKQVEPVESSMSPEDLDRLADLVTERIIAKLKGGR